jgi:hypothetical protein
VSGPPLVRLSRDGERAICAGCPELFAHRITRSEIVLPGRRAIVPLGLDSEMGATLRFLPGWTCRVAAGVLPGGVWTRSKRVRDRIAAGKKPAFRRRPEEASSDQFSRGYKLATFYPHVLLIRGCTLGPPSPPRIGVRLRNVARGSRWWTNTRIEPSHRRPRRHPRDRTDRGPARAPDRRNVALGGRATSGRLAGADPNS